MYIKVVRENKKDTNVENRLYSTNDVAYKKVRVNDIEGLKGNLPKIYNLISEIPKTDTFEYLNICLYDASEKISKILVAPCCSVYILNQEGRTIDSLHCK